MSERAEQRLEELVRLQVWQIRNTAESQANTISALLDAGLAAPRIAELLGTTPATVRAARGKQKQKSTSGRKK